MRLIDRVYSLFHRLEEPQPMSPWEAVVGVWTKVESTTTVQRRHTKYIPQKKNKSLPSKFFKK
jgi:hypothetical protein